jgi:hypothetical protein
MPASRFTHKANTAKKSRQWQHVYDSEIKRGRSKAIAIQAANGVLKKEAAGAKRRR